MSGMGEDMHYPYEHVKYHHQGGDSDVQDMFDGMDSELWQHMMNDPQLYNEYLSQNYSVYEDCLKPSIQQTIESVWLLLACCFLIRVMALLRLPRQGLHTISSATGLVVLWHFYQSSLIYVIIPCMVGFVLYQFNSVRKGMTFSLIAATYMLLCEKVLLAELEWNKVRGSVMIICMKLISLAFDYENLSGLKGLGIMEFYGYILNPASVIFGPFLTYKDYNQLLMHHPLSLSWFVNVIRAFGLSILCLLWSTCGTSNILTKLGDNRWAVAYREANAFRTSHYFVSFLSEGTCLLSGIGRAVPQPSSGKAKTDKEDSDMKSMANDAKKVKDPSLLGLRHRMKAKQENVKENKEENRDTNSNRGCKIPEKHIEEECFITDITWEYPAVKPLQVEIPRSLVDVVTNWNLPMHFWLKTYVFKPSRKFGVFPAILMTYMASSLLHGCNFQLSAVLLSIGIFAYIENELRLTLSETFNACVQARRCKGDCKHRYKQGNPWVIAANLMFGILAIWNLAYLGCLFDSNPEVEEKGYSMAHAVRKWTNLAFINHWLMIGLIIINKMIK